MINWNTNGKESRLIGAIVERASVPKSERLELMMDITAAHLNGCPLKLQELLDAPTFDFWHDVRGIQTHINRRTGQLLGGFLPRFAE